MPFYTDRSTISKRERTPEGYLRIDDVKIARVGVQDYLASELFDEKTPEHIRNEPNKIVVLYRPPEEVFHDEAMASFVNKPMTNNHPGILVDADNVKNYQVGFSRDTVRREGDYLVVDLVLQDKAAIKDVERGKVQVSNGYEANLVWDSGVTPDGIAYDAIQTNIRGNHIAIVEAGRAGSQVRLSDKNPKPNGDQPMPKKLIVDGYTIEFSEQGAEAVEKLQGQVTSLTQQLNDAKTAQSTELSDAQKEVETLKGQVEAEKAKQLSDAQVDELVASRAKLLGDAKAVLGDEDLTGKSEVEIKKAVVAKLNDSIDLADKSDAFVDGVYATMISTASKGSASDLASQLNDGKKDEEDSSTVLADAQKRFQERNAKAGRKPLGETA